jgi:hypothetical protein
MADDTRLSRISKLFLDRDETPGDIVLARRQKHSVVLRCGTDLRASYTLQLAVLTAANIANRCFPGAVTIALEQDVLEAPLLLWPSLGQTFGQALRCYVRQEALIDPNVNSQGNRVVIFGNAPPTSGALRVTFDGWIAKAGPATAVERLPEREYCSLSGILAAAFAISELFLSFAEITVEAGRRPIALSLWRPDLDVSDPAALGIPVEFLPRDLWLLGLGHLGNAYLWSLATLPYPESAAPQVFLNDFDKVESENVETGLIFNANDIHSYKTRTCSAWLERRGFQTAIVERRFDSQFRCREDEPRLALCGFDSNPARRDLVTARFLRVVESGLGGTADNFDTISLHGLPNPRKAEQLWPDLTAEEIAMQEKLRERLARENPAYRALGHDECGRSQLAGKSVAVPFVGAAAATLVLSEVIRLLHGGPAYTDMKLALSAPGGRYARTIGDYGAKDLAGLNYCESSKQDRLPRPLGE